MNSLCQTDLGYDDFFFKDFHGVVFPAGLFSDKNHFTEGSLSQQLQVVKVTHCLGGKKHRRTNVSDSSMLQMYMS